jgi:hypothetical protein
MAHSMRARLGVVMKPTKKLSSRSKLILHKTTLRMLRANELSVIAGGDILNSVGRFCVRTIATQQSPCPNG